MARSQSSLPHFSRNKSSASTSVSAPTLVNSIATMYGVASPYSLPSLSQSSTFGRRSNKTKGTSITKGNSRSITGTIQNHRAVKGDDEILPATSPVANTVEEKKCLNTPPPAPPTIPLSTETDDKCDLFARYHAVLHRFVEEGWMIRYLLDTTTRIKDVQEAQSSSTADPTSPLTPLYAHASRHGTMKELKECPICEDKSLARSNSSAFTPGSRAGRSPFTYRHESLKRWLRKKAKTSEESSRLIACISETASECFAYIGVADLWTSFSFQAGLPPISVPSPRSGSSTSTSTKRSAESLQLPQSVDFVQLSSFAVPDLHSVEKLNPSTVETLLRAYRPPDLPEWCPPQPINELCDFYRLSSAAEVHEGGKICEIYLAVPPAPASKQQQSSSAPPAGGAILGFVDAKGFSSSLTYAARSKYCICDAQQDEFPLSELFYITHCMEDYFRIGASLGWINGWQLCYSSYGPPENTACLLQWMFPSAFEVVMRGYQ